MSTFGQDGLARELYREGCPREVRMSTANGAAGGGKPGLELPDLTVTLFPVPCWILYLAKTIQMQIQEGRGTFGTVHAGRLQSTRGAGHVTASGETEGILFTCQLPS